MSKFLDLKRKLLTKFYDLCTDRSWLMERQYNGAIALPGGREQWELEKHMLYSNVELVMEMLGIERHFKDWKDDDCWEFSNIVLMKLWDEDGE